MLGICGLLGMLAPKRPWLWALGVGIWIPVFGILAPLAEHASRRPNFGSLLGLVFAFAGAYAGMVAGIVLRKVIIPAH